MTAVSLSLLLLFLGCEANSPNDLGGPLDIDGMEQDYSIKQNYSKFIGTWFLDELWWTFKTDGTILALLGEPDDDVSGGCQCGCGMGLNQMTGEYNYFIKNNYFVTYGPKMVEDQLVDDVTVNTFTMADDGFSFQCNRGNFEKGKASYSNGYIPPDYIPLALSNDCLGTWKGNDGKEYVFDSNSGLSINSKDYGYLVHNSELVTLGPFAKGATPVLQKYSFVKTGNKIYLRNTTDSRSNTIITLSAK